MLLESIKKISRYKPAISAIKNNVLIAKQAFDGLQFSTGLYPESGYKEGQFKLESLCKKVLLDENAFASAVYTAAVKLMGSEINAWEPESIWLTAEREWNLDIPQINRDKLLSVIALKIFPRFYWEVTSFENTILCFNNVQPNVELVQEASPEHLAWGVYEAELIVHLEDETTYLFDYEPRIYTAECLHRSGYILAPSSLEFAQEELDKRNKVDYKLKKEVSQVWNDITSSGTPLDEIEVDESPLGVQLSRLIVVQDYINKNLLAYNEIMRKFV